MLKVAILGPKNNVNTIFTLSTVGQGAIFIIWNKRLLKPTFGSMGPVEYRITNLTLELPLPPAPTDMLYAYVQPDGTTSLEPVTVVGTQNSLNTVFTLDAPVPPGTSLILNRTGEFLEEVTGSPTTTQFTMNGQIVTLGLAPGPFDTLRGFITAPGTVYSGPGTGVIRRFIVTGAQDALNTRFLLSDYTPSPSTEPLLFLTNDGLLNTQVLGNPGVLQYRLLSARDVLLGYAPSLSSTMQYILVGQIPVTVSPYTFTARRVAQKLQIWLQRRVNEPEAEEIVAQTYREYVDTYQWQFLQVQGSFTTEAPKSVGTVTVTQGSRGVKGIGTAFGPDDVGKFFRLSSYSQAYRITAAFALSQRIELATPYADASATNQPYAVIKTVYTLGPEVEYLFSAASRWALREIPYSSLTLSDPTRTAVADVPYYYSYLGKTEDGAQQIEVYPVPSQPAVVTYVGIRKDACEDPGHVLRGLEALIINASAAAGCRMLMLKENGGSPEALGQLMGTYESKASGILDRLLALDFTQSDIPNVQRMRSNLSPAYDGQYQATHDTWLLGDW